MAHEPLSFHTIVRSLLAAALIAVLIAVAWQLLDLLVLVVGAAIIAVLLHGTARWVSRHTPLGPNWSLAVVLLAISAVIGLGGWLFGAQLSGQFGQLAEQLPSSVEALRQRVEQLPGGESIVSSLEKASPGGNLVSRLGGVVGSLAGFVTDFFLLVFGAIFIAAAPGTYRRGLLSLVPPSRRAPVDDALSDVDASLRQWMVGQLISMVLIGLLVGLGLSIIGVPSALALGLIAGLAEAIPMVGPVIGAVPILVVALADGIETGLLALGLIVVVQQVESNLIMPYIQKKIMSLPPALTLFGVVAGGLLFGPIGLIFAAPLLVIVVVLVKRLYVEAALGTPERKAARTPAR